MNTNYLKVNKSVFLRIFSIAIIAGGLVGCQSSAPTEALDEHDHDEHFFHVNEAQMTLAGIEVGYPEWRTIENAITSNGMVDVPPGSLADISAPLGGFVRKANLYEGAFVKKGATLIALEHPEYIRMQQEYLEVKAQWEFADKDYGRQYKLLSGRAAAEKAIDEAKSNRDMLAARMAGLAGQLRIAGINPNEISTQQLQSQVYLKAPFDGYISMVNVNLGKQVGPEDVLYQMVNPKHLHLELQVFPEDVHLVREGQKLLYQLQGDANWHSGHVVLVSKTVNPELRTIRVHAHPDDESAVLKPGTFVRAKIAVVADSVYCLPEGAFREENGQMMIFVKEGDGFQGIPVETGLRGNGYIEIKKMNHKGPFITQGAYYLAEVDEEDHDH
jgi:cobalt-zinc-cadmium efflux system membrane fusion protein